MPEETICLNMIVKNEEKILKDTFDNLLKYFNFSNYVIVDTGSTDNTVKVIKDYFKEKNIRGKIHVSPFRDFGYNRTEALEKAFNTSDYLLVFDADDRIKGNLVLPNKLTADAYNLILGDEKFNYTRPLLITNRKKWRFVGVLHEYLEAVKFAPVYQTLEGNYYVNSGRFGNRNQQTNKYERDAEVFEKAILTCEPSLKARYTFYTAQSYKDANNIDKAIEWYIKRIGYQGFIQEVYYSCLMLGHLFMVKGNVKDSLKYYEMSHSFDDERIEGLYYIIKYYREKNEYDNALQYYDKITKPINIKDKLFVFSNIYDYLMDIELAILHLKYDQEKGLNNLIKLFNADYTEDILKTVISILANYIIQVPKFTNLKFLGHFYKFAKKIPLAELLPNKLILLLVSKYEMI